MAKFRTFKRIYRRTEGNVAFAAGTTGIQYRFPRWDNRLVSLTIHANVTLGAGMVTSGAGRPGLEGIFSAIKWNMSDLGTSARDSVNVSSAQLIYWNKLNAGKGSRYGQTVIGQVAAGTYEVLIRIPFVHPGASNLVRYRQSVPFWEKGAGDALGLGDDPTLTIDCAALDSASLGIKTGTLTFNDVKVVAKWLAIGKAAGVAYAPMELSTFRWDTVAAGANQKIPFPKDGFLTGFMMEQFATPATGVYGAVLTSATSGTYFLNFGGQKLDEFYPVETVDDQDRFADSAPTDIAAATAHNIPADVLFHDFMFDDNHNDAGSLDSCPNLYQGGNKGDALELEPNDIQTGKQLRFTTHKFLTPTTPDLLTGS